MNIDMHKEKRRSAQVSRGTRRRQAEDLHKQARAVVRADVPISRVQSGRLKKSEISQIIAKEILNLILSMRQDPVSIRHFQLSKKWNCPVLWRI